MVDDREALVWRYLLDNRLASAAEVATMCSVSEEYAQTLIDRVGTPREVFEAEAGGTLDRQFGGSHYRDMGVQPWEALAAWLTPEEHRGYHKGVAIGYLAREQAKGGDEDIQKAIHHLERLLEVGGAHDG